MLQDEVAVPDLPAPPEPAIVWEDEHLLVIDKPPGLVVHPGAGHASGTLVHALAGKIAGGDPERPGRRASPRPRHVRADGARALGGVPPPAHGARSGARVRADVHGARARQAALARRADRGADRPRPRRRDACLARHGHAARGDHELRGRARLPARMRCCGSGSRRGGCTRSASTWRRSTCRWPATPPTARRSRASAAVPARLGARVPASVQRRAGRDRLGAPGRPRVVPRRPGLTSHVTGSDPGTCLRGPCRWVCPRDSGRSVRPALPSAAETTAPERPVWSRSRLPCRCPLVLRTGGKPEVDGGRR